MAFYEASEDECKRELAAGISEITRLSQLVDDTSTDVTDLQERLVARDVVTWSIIEYSYASLGPSFRGLVEIFRAGLIYPVDVAFQAGSIGSQYHADTAINGFTLCFSEAVSSMATISLRARTLWILLLTRKLLNCS